MLLVVTSSFLVVVAVVTICPVVSTVKGNEVGKFSVIGLVCDLVASIICVVVKLLVVMASVVLIRSVGSTVVVLYSVVETVGGSGEEKHHRI